MPGGNTGLLLPRPALPSFQHYPVFPPGKMF